MSLFVLILISLSSIPAPVPDCPVLAGPRSAETSGSGPALSERSEFSRTPLGSSTAGCPVAKRRGPRLRVAFLLGTFLWRSKEKCLARRGETRPAAYAKRTDACHPRLQFRSNGIAVPAGTVRRSFIYNTPLCRLFAELCTYDMPPNRATEAHRPPAPPGFSPMNGPFFQTIFMAKKICAM